VDDLDEILASARVVDPVAALVADIQAGLATRDYYGVPASRVRAVIVEPHLPTEVRAFLEKCNVPSNGDAFLAALHRSAIGVHHVCKRPSRCEHLGCKMMFSVSDIGRPKIVFCRNAFPGTTSIEAFYTEMGRWYFKAATSKIKRIGG
jgi:hypothetical protein